MRNLCVAVLCLVGMAYCASEVLAAGCSSTSSNGSVKTPAVSGLCLALSVGDVYSLKHKTTIASGTGEAKTSIDTDGETTLAVVGQDGDGNFIVYGQCVSKRSNEKGQRQGIFSYIMNRAGQAKSFPGRQAVFAAKAIQGGDPSYGLLTPFGLECAPMELGRTWQASFAAGFPAQDSALIPAKLDHINGTVADIVATVNTNASGLSCLGSIDLQFDTAKGLPIAWDSSLVMNRLDSDWAGSVSSHTSVVVKDKLRQSDLLALQDIGKSLRDIQNDIASARHDDALARMTELRKLHAGSNWLNGLDALEAIRQLDMNPRSVTKEEETE